MHENFTTCNKYIPSSTKNINLDFYQDIGLQNGVSMGMLISWSQARRLGVNKRAVLSMRLPPPLGNSRSVHP
jgi:hypothetical protein